MNYKLCEELKPAEKILSKYEKNTHLTQIADPCFCAFPNVLEFSHVREKDEISPRNGLLALRMRTLEHCACAPGTAHAHL